LKDLILIEVEVAVVVEKLFFDNSRRVELERFS